MVTLGKILEQNRGIGPGFDFLRIALAVSILCSHAFDLTGNFWLFNTTPAWYANYALVPMFFALSGFLIAGSARRLTLKNFLINRGLRIIPALSVDTIVCAFVIGTIFTTFPLRQYFTHSAFFWYLLNVTGYVHFQLPGVFQNHPDTNVNGALWTVPYEMACYAVMSFFIITQWIKRPFVVATLLVVLVAGLIVQHIYDGTAHPGYLLRALNFFLVFRGAQAVATFIMGIFLYQMRDRVPYSWLLFWICCGLSLFAMLHFNYHAIDRVGNRFFFLPPLVYMTTFLGLTKIPLPRFFHSGDYSYGVYLYHEPFLQIIVGLVPITVALKGGGAFILILLGILPVFAVAWTSWHFVEKPLLALRKKFSFVAKVRGVEEPLTGSIGSQTPVPVTNSGSA